MQISFSAVYSPPTPGSSAWSVSAQNIQVKLTVPQGGLLPPSFTAQLIPSSGGNPQTITLQNSGGRVYTGTMQNSVLIRSGSMGLSHGYDQFHEFTPQNASSLIDPINGTPRFQTNLFFAAPFATTSQGQWNHI
jgi:hypothetical protein